MKVTMEFILPEENNHPSGKAQKTHWVTFMKIAKEEK